MWLPAEHRLAQRWVDEQGEKFTIDQWRTFRVRGLLGNIEERRAGGRWSAITTDLEPASGDDRRVTSSPGGLAAALDNLIDGLNSELARRRRRARR